MAEFIWNGVGLTTPDGWEPSALERDGLFLGCEGQPVCELKWRTVQGTFSFEKHIKRLSKGHKGVDMHGVPESETPPVWGVAIKRLAESGIRSQSFIWRTQYHKGIGAALHNPATGMAALIQFFISGNEDEAIASEALASFRDYTGGKTLPWAMFGLSARIPVEFNLDTFSFQPGHYMVKYWRPKTAKQANRLPAGKGPGVSLVFERFAPASVLLEATSLDAWMDGALEEAPPKGLPMDVTPESVLWAGVAKTSLLRAFVRREIYTQGRVWLTGAGNSILSVVTRGNIPLPDELINDIIASYELT